ncbi:hypothetical protein KEM09_00140 [Carboxylicivirga mesophila]|uniref:Uncharacterized protein n=1 Tax=Carboxylicivirga mesophila TaxID=1166478 RepID=A0ABS5K5H9_9BACT|nr:DUF6452 family protein [Carboxylicivirga mesophila]MBS2209791.1 hypothetical protein [Carboxylicivirga mesophila]
MKIKPFGHVFLAATILLLVACDESSLCLSGQNAIQAGLYSGASGEAKDTTLNGVYLWGYDEINDANLPLLIDSARVQKMYMPTNIERDTTSFVFREQTIASDIVDTIMFVYTRELNYVSGDCGFTYNLHIDTVIHTINIIDSVVVSYPSVLYNENLENVKIFIEP